MDYNNQIRLINTCNRSHSNNGHNHQNNRNHSHPVRRYSNANNNYIPTYNNNYNNNYNNPNHSPLINRNNIVINNNNYTKEEILNQMNETKLTCLEDYIINDIVIYLPCFHFYHKKCISEWFKRMANCPTCKLPIDD